MKDKIRIALNRLKIETYCLNVSIDLAVDIGPNFFAAGVGLQKAF